MSVRPTAVFDTGSNSNAQPIAGFDNLTGPIPTNKWNGNATLWFPGDPAPGLQPVNVGALNIKFAQSGLNVCVPYLQTATDAQGQILAEIAPFVMNMNLSASELNSSATRSIPEQTEFGMTLQWDAGNNRQLVAPVVQGMPMASAHYANLTPCIQTQQAIMAVNGGNLPGATVSGTRFEITLNNNQTWVLYSEYDINLTWSNNNGVWQLQADKPYDGWIRTGILSNDLDIDNDPAFLDSIKGCVPTEGFATDAVEGDQIQTTFTWNSARFAGDSTSQLAMMALPHHQKALTQSVSDSISVPTLKGTAKAVIGDSWNLVSQKRDIPWLENPDFNSFEPEQQSAILAALAQEQVGQLNPADTYFYSKALARVAKVILIAKQAGNDSKQQEFLSALEQSIEPWILSKGHSQDNQLVYDQTWGGLVQKAALSDANTDFGNGIYNDHHFHYGYMIYAAAILQKMDPDFMDKVIPNSNGAVYRDWFKLVAKDYANSDSQDPDFPLHRHQDRYNGHSWANGLVATGDGKNQESVSEACNAYYGLAMFAEAIGDETLLNSAQALLDREITAAQNYWQIRRDNSSAYLPGVAAAFNNCVVNVWGGKDEAQTWFGNGKAGETHLIGSCFPCTPMLRQIVDPTWLQENYDTMRTLAAGFDGELSAWRFTAVQNLALGVRPEDYDVLWQWALEADPTTIDDGMTRTDLLYSVASGIQLAKQLQKAREASVEISTSSQVGEPVVPAVTAARVEATRSSNDAITPPQLPQRQRLPEEPKVSRNCCSLFGPIVESVSAVANEVGRVARSVANDYQWLGRSLLGEKPNRDNESTKPRMK